MNLFTAHNQWSTRPDDERFTSLEDLHAATRAYADTAVERDKVKASTLRVEAIDGDVQLLGRGGIPARLTNWAFAQLCARVGAPASYLQDLPATLAAQNVNHGLAHRIEKLGDNLLNLLFHNNGSLLLRALTSEKYSRVWNYEITDRLLGLKSQGWDVARPTLGWGGDGRLPLYASDHDCFAFICHSDRVVKEAGNPDGLIRGMIVINSEVGASKLRRLRFLYRGMCGNHIIWDASDLDEVALVHTGNIRDRVALWTAEITKYADASTSDEELIIEKARTKRIAATKEEVLDNLFGRRLGLTRKALDGGYDAVIPDQDGDPRSPWGILQGLTRYSQTIPYADQRQTIDLAAGKILSLVDAF
jgi:hypothetical protein